MIIIIIIIILCAHFMFADISVPKLLILFFKLFKEIGINTRNLVYSAQDRDYWRALVNAELNLWVA